MAIDRIELSSASLASQLPWPSSTGLHIIEKFEFFGKGNKPIYYSIGEIVQEELNQLHDLVYLKQKVNTDSPGDIALLWEILEGYQELEARTDWAMMLEETNGEVENHPNYIDTFGRPLLGVQFGGWSDASHYIASYLHDQKILKLVRQDHTGMKLLQSHAEEVEEKIKRAGQSPIGSSRLLGFMKAKRRYGQILDYLMQNESIA